MRLKKYFDPIKSLFQFPPSKLCPESSLASRGHHGNHHINTRVELGHSNVLHLLGAF